MFCSERTELLEYECGLGSVWIISQSNEGDTVKRGFVFFFLARSVHQR